MTAELVVASRYNTAGNNPATGKLWRDGDEFVAEAEAYIAFHGIKERLRLVDCRVKPWQRFNQLLACIDSARRDGETPLGAFTFLCHGFKSGLQFGSTLQNVAVLADSMAKVAAEECTVTLYACSAGADNDPKTSDVAQGPGGDGGFADVLRDFLVDRGVKARVLAHTTKGHCTRNPFVREYVPGQKAGGEWLVLPGSGLWPNWRRALQSGHMRYMFPKLSREQVLESLR